MTFLLRIQDRVRPGFLIAIFVILCAGFLTTYSGRVQSGDTIQIYDAINSYVYFGDLGRDETIWRDPPKDLFTTPDEQYQLSPYEPTEAGIVYIGSIFFRLIYLLPQVGLLHGMFLFNIIVTALTGVMLIVIARQLGYKDLTAFVMVLCYGFCTVAWWYSKTLFREPLAALFLVVSLSLLLRWRLDYKQVWIPAITLLILFIGFRVEQSSALGWFGLAIFAIPQINSRFFYTITSIALLFGTLILIVLSLAAPILYYTGFDPDLRLVALYSYLASPGGSLWGTSPILLLTLPSIGLLWIQDKTWWWGVLLIVLGFAVGHAWLTGVHWFGGLSSPPRFLVPVVPFCALLTLPAITWLLRQRRSIVWYVVAIMIVCYSFAIQLITNLTFLPVYQDLLPEQALRLFEWIGGLTDPRYFRWVLFPRSWGSIGLDTAWHRIALQPMYWLFLTVAISTAIILRFQRWLLWFMPIVLLAVTGFGLNRLYHEDNFYWANSAALFEAYNILEREAKNQEPLLLSAPIYDEFIFNYNRLNQVRPIVFGHQAGEAISPQQPAKITSTYVPSLLEIYAPSILDDFAYNHDRIWLLAHDSEFLDYAIRPVEQFLNATYYLLQEYRTSDPNVRLLLYDTTRAPQQGNFRLPQYETTHRFGNNIALLGFTLPEETVFSGGDVVPFSLFWQTDTKLSENYVVATFLMKADLSFPIIEGINTQPNNGFDSTSTWQANTPIIDNRAIQLPDNVPDGEYQIWVVLYDRALGGNARLPITDGGNIDSTIALLPITLTISTNN